MTDFTLKGVGLLAQLSDEAIEELNRRCAWRRYAPGELILDRDDPSTPVYFLTRGEVRIVIFTGAGKQVSLGEIRAGGHFGELAALDGRPRSASVVALTRATVATMQANVFLDLLRRYPEIDLALLRQLAIWVRSASTRVMELSTLDTRRRIGAELVRLTETRLRADKGAVISPPPLHADLAARVGARREAVTREINHLSRMGLLHRRRGAWEIPDIERLARMIDTSSAGAIGDAGIADTFGPDKQHASDL